MSTRAGGAPEVRPWWRQAARVDDAESKRGNGMVSRDAHHEHEGEVGEAGGGLERRRRRDCDVQTNKMMLTPYTEFPSLLQCPERTKPSGTILLDVSRHVGDDSGRSNEGEVAVTLSSPSSISSHRGRGRRGIKRGLSEMGARVSVDILIGCGGRVETIHGHGRHGCVPCTSSASCSGR